MSRRAAPEPFRQQLYLREPEPDLSWREVAAGIVGLLLALGALVALALLIGPFLPPGYLG